MSLEERLARLATEKANLELLNYILREIAGGAPGLENTIRRLLSSIIQGVGGSNAILYYWVDSELRYADALGEWAHLDELPDPETREVYRTRKPYQGERDFSETRMMTAEFSRAFSWIYPLVAGGELVGIIRVDGLHVSSRIFERHLDNLFAFAAAVLRNEIFNETRIKRANDELVATNTRLTAEVSRRTQAEAQLQTVNERLEQDVLHRTAELRSALRGQQALAHQTRRKAAELQSVLDTMVEGVMVANTNGEIVLANPAGLRILGEKSTVGLRLPLREIPARLQLRDGRGQVLSVEQMALSRALAGEIVVDMDEIIRRNGNSRDTELRVSSAPIRVGRRVTGAVVVMRDVTELRGLERLKDQFLAVAAHELKTPVAVMKGFAEALLRKASDLSEPRRRMLEAINRGADRIDVLILDLLDISRMAEGHLELKLERIDLMELIETVVHPMAVSEPKHCIQVAEGKSVVTLADRNRIEQVLGNLLSNAIKYSPGGGDIDVSLTVKDGRAIISIRDHGIGIPADKQAGIFQRFYRAHTGTPYDYGGMGVGLCISKEIVNRHGGEIWFESRENEGSTFSFSLPLRG